MDNTFYYHCLVISVYFVGILFKFISNNYNFNKIGKGFFILMNILAVFNLSIYGLGFINQIRIVSGMDYLIYGITSIVYIITMVKYILSR